MKVIHLFVLSLLIIVDFLEITGAEDGVELVAMKRPFCNAFTGCGRKRDPAYAGTNYGGSLQVPIPVYRTLLRMATADGNAEVRMRQRLARAGSFEPVPNQLLLPRANLF